VIPAFSPGELYGSVPELADICNMETEKLYGVFSENMGPEQWIGTAEAIAAEIEKGRGRHRRGARHRHDASHGRGADLHGAGLTCADRHGRAASARAIARARTRRSI
jgi:hypothetical protein